MEKGKTLESPLAPTALGALELEVGETLLYRATGRFLAATGIEGVPLNSWGLLVLTPTRLYFRHYAQSHPLFGGKDAEVRWEIQRTVFEQCQRVVQPFWEKLLSGTSDHVALSGAGVRLALETADDQRKFPQAWAR